MEVHCAMARSSEECRTCLNIRGNMMMLCEENGLNENITSLGKECILTATSSILWQCISAKVTPVSSRRLWISEFPFQFLFRLVIIETNPSKYATVRSKVPEWIVYLPRFLKKLLNSAKWRCGKRKCSKIWKQYVLLDGQRIWTIWYLKWWWLYLA